MFLNICVLSGTVSISKVRSGGKSTVVVSLTCRQQRTVRKASDEFPTNDVKKYSMAHLTKEAFRLCDLYLRLMLIDRLG